MVNVFYDNNCGCIENWWENETAEFVTIFYKVFKILNIKNPLNEAECAPFKSLEDPRFHFLGAVENSLQEMVGGKESQPVPVKWDQIGLHETLQAFSTCLKHLLEAQLFGGRFRHLSPTQWRNRLHYSLKLQRMRLFSKLMHLCHICSVVTVLQLLWN